jgi:hypothetical protein
MECKNTGKTRGLESSEGATLKKIGIRGWRRMAEDREG